MNTLGHTAIEPGLRGHSVDEETFPWRVVGGYWEDPYGRLLGTWEVQGPDGRTMARFCEALDAAGKVQLSLDEACSLAHGTARALKRQHPEGVVQS